MSGIGLYLPIIAHPSHHGKLKSEMDDRVDKKIDEIDFIGFINSSSHIKNAVKEMKPLFWIDDEQDVWFLHPSIFGVQREYNLDWFLQHQDLIPDILVEVNHGKSFDLIDFSNSDLEKEFNNDIEFSNFQGKATYGILFSKTLQRLY